ncbi:hypothetical protein Tco_0925659 [Tanacetum coccineum]|uniref:Uncharacterized protein n=1 Tax=Tanacetum coccineum TaxID=301880 RepID=A0ABQ5D7I5_9ASTR
MFDDSDFDELDDINNMVDDAMENVEGDAETHGRNSDKTEELNLSVRTEVFEDKRSAEKEGSREKGGSTAEQITTDGDIVNTASIDISVVGPSTSTAGDIFEDEMMTIADTLVAIRSTRPRTTSVVIRDVEEEPRRATPVPTVQSQDKGKGKMVEPEPTPKNPIKTQIQRDAEIAQRLFEEEQAQFEREQRIARERAAEQEAKDAALIAEFEDVQARMDADALLAARLQEKEREQFSIDEQARFLVETIAERKREHKWINDFILMNFEEGGKKAESCKKEATSCKKRQKAYPDDENVKRQKLEDAAEKEGLKAYLKFIPDEDRAVNYETIATIVAQEGDQVLKEFDRDDLVKLWDLVKKRFSTTEPTDDKEKELWVELKRLFKPDNDDILWKLQRYMHDPLVWRLYDTCGVHHVSLVRGHDIFMLVEKEYPLTRGTLRLMMVARLLVEADSEMSRELLRKIFYQANRPRQ